MESSARVSPDPFASSADEASLGIVFSETPLCWLPVLGGSARFSGSADNNPHNDARSLVSPPTGPNNPAVPNQPHLPDTATLRALATPAGTPPLSRSNSHSDAGGPAVPAAGSDGYARVGDGDESADEDDGSSFRSVLAEAGARDAADAADAARSGAGAEPGDEHAVLVLPRSISVDANAETEAEEAMEEAERRKKAQADLIDLETNFWRIRNFSIPLFYFVLGYALRFPTVALREFLINDLTVSPHLQSLVVGVVMYLPFSMKIFFAFLSDGVPILGQRRKPYMLGGIVMASCAWIVLGSLKKPSIDIVASLLFVATLGIVWCDTMVDTLVVERMRHEHGSQVGKMQTMCWMLRYLGMFIGILIGGWLQRYAHAHPQTLFLSLGIFIFVICFPSMIPLADEGMRAEDGSRMEPPTFKENVSRIWEAVQLNSIWKPMIFVYIWNVLPNDGDAWVNFLLKELRFSADEYSYILAIGTVSGALGAFLYRTCLRNTPLHPIFYVTIVLSAVLSCIPFILITRANREWGMPDFAFAMGNEVINDVAGFIMYMPVLIMCSKLCPDQVEGSVYALTCVVNNIGAQIAMNFSSLLTDAFGITLTDYSNLWQLHLVVVLFMFIPMLFVPLTPNRPGEGNPAEIRREAARVESLLESRRAKRKLLSIRAGLPTPSAATSPLKEAGDNAEPAAPTAAVRDESSEDETVGPNEGLIRERGAGLARPPSDAPMSRSDDLHDDDGEPVRPPPPGGCSCGSLRFCACCGCCGTIDDADEAEIDESTVSEARWRLQEASLETKLSELREKASVTVLPSSKLGGGFFLAVIFGSLIWSTGDASYRLSRL